MDITKRRVGDVTILDLKGKLTIGAAPKSCATPWPASCSRGSGKFS